MSKLPRRFQTSEGREEERDAGKGGAKAIEGELNVLRWMSRNIF